MLGRRCQVCTGCGLCPGVSVAAKGNTAEGMHILAGESDEAIDLRNEKGFRLVAVDIGTTTIAMEVYGEDGRVADTFVTVNPQVKYGSDVVSRITAARDPEVFIELRQLVKSALFDGMKRFLKCINSGEKLLAVIAANTTMSYLLMGWDPKELGTAPFHAGKLQGAYCKLVLEALEPDATERVAVPCVLLPGISAFVGGDICAGIYAGKMATKEEVTLLIDLGTNGEMALGNRERILTTATAAGPAFEGGANRGIWGADMVHFLAILRDKGIVDETGLMAEPYFKEGIRIGNVLVTKESVRSLQVAKAAIAAGIRILAKEYGITMEEIQQVILAGGFGYYLHPEDAVKIGMLPKALEKKTISGGNTALRGAKQFGASLLRDLESSNEAFLSDNGFGGKWNVLEDIGFISKAEVINLAMHPDFSDDYVNAMELKEWEE